MKTFLDSTYACTVLIISMLGHCNQTLQGKSDLCIPFLEIARPQYQFPYSSVCERFIYTQDRFTYFPVAEEVDWSWKYINLSQIYECRNWETKHYNSVVEITVSFLGIHKWESDIYIGFSPALHLQWRDKVVSKEKQPTIDDKKCLELFYELFIPGRREGGRAEAIWLHKDTPWSEFLIEASRHAI
jgi:hypothetical protein